MEATVEIVLIVAKCNVNFFSNATKDIENYVLIVAKCNVNLSLL